MGFLLRIILKRFGVVVILGSGEGSGGFWFRNRWLMKFRRISMETADGIPERFGIDW